MSVLNALSKTQLTSKYQACLLGALLGDCIGSKFEGFTVVTYDALQKHIWPQDEENSKIAKDSSKLRYTDDTAMTRSVANSLIANDQYNSVDMADRFASEFDKEPNRGYGTNVCQVFVDLKEHKFSDVYESSRRQFGGSGSYGNGAAMRVAPIPLYAADNIEKMIEITRDSSTLTHSHVDGYNGAILQCLAIHQALSCEATTEPLTFIRALMDTFAEHVTTDKAAPKDSAHIRDINRPSYTEKLKLIESYFRDTPQPNISDTEIQDNLGCHISAKGSVPTAIYCFLRTLKPVDGIDFDKGCGFARCLIYAISLGGDTDTIASMAGSIAGAYYGVDELPTEWVARCEGSETARAQADSLLHLALKQEQAAT